MQDQPTITMTAPNGETTGPVSLDHFRDAVDRITGEISPFAQRTLDDKVFAAYTPEHQVSLKLTKGSDKRSLGAFGKLLSGEVLERGREVIVVARYFAKAVHVPAAMTEHGFVAPGDGTVELELINVRSLEVGRQLLRKESPWQACHCLEPYDIEADGEYPGGRRVLEYPLDGWSSLQGCMACAGLGYVRPIQMPDDVNPEDGE